MPVITAPPEPTHRIGDAAFTALASPSRGSVETSVWTVELPPRTPGTPHELTREEVFVIVTGSATVRLGDERAQVGAGDAIVVPPDTTFELANLGDVPLRAVVCFPVGGQARLDGSTFTPPWAE